MPPKYEWGHAQPMKIGQNSLRHVGLLAEGQHTDPDKSVLMQASIKLDHPETYTGSSDLEEFEAF